MRKEDLGMHANGSDRFKQAYNMKLSGNDCFIDTKNLVVVGRK